MAKLIVPRGFSPEYYAFLNVTAVTNRDELIVDRRLGTDGPSVQSGAVESHQSDRRGPLPPTWARDRVIVVDDHQVPR
jgi:hypothetical protein